MNTLPDLLSHPISLHSPIPRLLLIETGGRLGEGITELFAAMALHGPLYAIAGGEWLPTYALVRALRRQTATVDDVISRVRISRPFTCYQLLDLLTDTRPERNPMLVLDFLHHFHNPDIPLDVRWRVLRQCCNRLERLSLWRPLIVLVQALQTEEYQSFLPLVADTADEFLQAAELGADQVFQPVLF